MANFQPPPTYADPIVEDGRTKKPYFNPIWLKWFLDIAQYISVNGGGSSTPTSHNSLSGLQGGATGEYYHTTAAEHGALVNVVANQSAETILCGPLSGAAAAPTFKRLHDVTVKTSTQSVTSSTVLVNDADLVAMIGANETWCGRLFVHFSAAIETTGVKCTITAPSGATGQYIPYMGTDANSGNEVYVDGTVAFGTVTDITAAYIGAGATSGFLEIALVVVNGSTPGNLQFQWAQSTSSASALVAGIGSQFVINRVT